MSISKIPLALFLMAGLASAQQDQRCYWLSSVLGGGESLSSGYSQFLDHQAASRAKRCAAIGGMIHGYRTMLQSARAAENNSIVAGLNRMQTQVRTLESFCEGTPVSDEQLRSVTLYLVEGCRPEAGAAALQLQNLCYKNR